MTRAGRALVAIADRENREALIQVLELCGLEPITCSTVGEISAILASEANDLLFCDTAFADSNFEDLPHTMSSGKLSTPVLVCSRFDDADVYLDVMNRGAFDFIVYPYRTDEVKWVVGTARRKYLESALQVPANSRRAVSG